MNDTILAELNSITAGNDQTIGSMESESVQSNQSVGYSQSQKSTPNMLAAEDMQHMPDAIIAKPNLFASGTDPNFDPFVNQSTTVSLQASSPLTPTVSSKCIQSSYVKCFNINFSSTYRVSRR